MSEQDKPPTLSNVGRDFVKGIIDPTGTGRFRDFDPGEGQPQPGSKHVREKLLRLNADEITNAAAVRDYDPGTPAGEAPRKKGRAVEEEPSDAKDALDRIERDIAAVQADASLTGDSRALKLTELRKRVFDLKRTKKVS